MAIDKIYRVTENINEVSKSSIDELESTIGGLPKGYRDFLAHCGENGELCDELQVRSPKEILSELEWDRKNFTFDLVLGNCDPGSLTKNDFQEHCLFATTVNGDRVFYFPRFAGTLFTAWRNGQGIDRHPQAFLSAWRLGNGGSHPFPYFVPSNKQRLHRSFDFEVSCGTMRLARVAAEYWSGEEVHRIRMPKRCYGDQVCVFVKRIGGQISFVYEPENDPRFVFGGISFDKGFTGEVKQFEKYLESFVEC